MNLLKRTWADVSLDHLEYNYRQLRDRAGTSCRFLGVVKADSYGHGAVPVSRTLVELGAEYLAVSNLQEAVQLRRNGIEAPVLLLGYTPAQYAAELAAFSVTQEVHSLQYARLLSDALRGTGKVLKVHLKLDTGMTRLGFPVETERDLEALLAAVRLPQLQVEGVFTHFSVADSTDPSDVAYTKGQYECFCRGICWLEAHGVDLELRHCANSGAVMLHPEYCLDMIRPGIATYGIHPSEDTCGVMELKPLLRLTTTISQLREIPVGTAISYGRTYTASEPRRLAVLAIGYADGLTRALSGRVSFLIGGHEAPVVGRITMDMCMVDVTDIPQVQTGDEAVLIGEGRPCEYLADLLDTIPYEIFCQISKRVPRCYHRSGKTEEILQYIV